MRPWLALLAASRFERVAAFVRGIRSLAASVTQSYEEIVLRLFDIWLVSGLGNCHEAFDFSIAVRLRRHGRHMADGFPDRIQRAREGKFRPVLLCRAGSAHRPLGCAEDVGQGACGGADDGDTASLTPVWGAM
jgi:hypothetical protein